MLNASPQETRWSRANAAPLSASSTYPSAGHTTRYVEFHVIGFGRGPEETEHHRHRASGLPRRRGGRSVGRREGARFRSRRRGKGGVSSAAMEAVADMRRSLLLVRLERRSDGGRRSLVRVWPSFDPWRRPRAPWLARCRHLCVTEPADDRDGVGDRHDVSGHRLRYHEAVTGA